MKHKDFYCPCLVHRLLDRGGCISPHLRFLQNLLTGNVPTYSVHPFPGATRGRWICDRVARCPWSSLSHSGDWLSPLISLCFSSSSPVRQQTYFCISQGCCCGGKSNAAEALGCTGLCKDASRACIPTKRKPLPQRRLLFAGWTHGQLVKHAGTLWDECQTTASAKNPGWGNDDKLPEIMVYSNLVPLQGKRKQNITIGRSPWTALERKTPAPNHSQQNNHKCRMEKKEQIMRYYLLFITVPKVNVYLYPHTNRRRLHRL